MIVLLYFRLSSNSRTEPSYLENNENNTSTKDSSRVNTPANTTCGKPAFSPTNTENHTTNDRMVSPKRKVEHFQHLYVANNVKTSTFNEQIEKSNLSTTKNNLNNSHEYSKYNCSHSSVNMVPERDTGPNKVNSGSVNAVGNLRIPQNQSGSKYSGEYASNDDHKMVSSRQHHHVSVQELRMQVKNLE